MLNCNSNLRRYGVTSEQIKTDPMSGFNAKATNRSFIQIHSALERTHNIFTDAVKMTPMSYSKFPSQEEQRARNASVLSLIITLSSKLRNNLAALPLSPIRTTPLSFLKLNIQMSPNTTMPFTKPWVSLH